MTAILSDIFETKLGIIQTWIESENNVYEQQQDKFKVAAEEHDIYLQSFDLKEIWLPEIMEYENAKGWRWFIRKTGKQKEQLTIFCTLINPFSDSEWSSDSGEHLDAIEIENKTHHLHIGTEDGERMQHRADVSNWMPERFKDEIRFHKSFTEYVDFGFKVNIPNLEKDEKIYFHFIVATNTIKRSKEYPNEKDISTWFAVDQSKNWLDKQLEK